MSEVMFLYVIEADIGCVKIGLSKDPESRLRQIIECQPYTAKIFRSYRIDVDRALLVERKAHILLRDYHRRGEWFDVDAHSASRAVEQAIQTWNTPQDAYINYGPQFTLGAWLDVMNLTDLAAADLLGLSRNSVIKYKVTPPPKYIRMACQVLEAGLSPDRMDRNEQKERARIEAYKQRRAQFSPA